MVDNLIKSHELVSNKLGPRVLVIAGVHGDEYEPMLAAHNIIENLQGKLICGSMIVVPVAHEDAYFHKGRCGSDHLDLARTCPSDVTGENMDDSARTITQQVAFELSTYIRQADYLIDMHTGGLTYEIFPMVGYMLTDDPILLEKQRELAIATGLPLIWGTDAKPNGRTLSVARDASIPALYFEYGGGTGYRQQVVETYKKAVEGVLQKLGMLELDYHKKWIYWAEDYRSDSGYLQDKMPAPADGVFIAAVSLGEQVQAGQHFGSILDPIQNLSFPVYAKTSGLVFLLRTLIQVKKGDALGGIIETKPTEKTVVYES